MSRRDAEPPQTRRILDVLALVGAVLPWLLAALFRWAAKDQTRR